MLTIATNHYTLLCCEAEPGIHNAYAERAKLAEKFDYAEHRPGFCWVAARPANAAWPTLVVEQRYSPAGFGFDPGLLIIPETEILLLGAGTRLLAYDLAGPARLWEDDADHGFWSWGRHDGTILMSAELELAAWDLNAKKLWTTYVEPPWEYRVDGGTVHLDVMGEKSAFPLATGPKT
jgi:hypothetical protein